jgi:hypothetical protein
MEELKKHRTTDGVPFDQETGITFTGKQDIPNQCPICRGTQYTQCHQTLPLKGSDIGRPMLIMNFVLKTIFYYYSCIYSLYNTINTVKLMK